LNVEGLKLKDSGVIIVVIIFCLSLFLTVAHAAEPLTTPQMSSSTDAASETELTYYMEISISQNILTLYEKKSATEKTFIAEYSVGTAIRGLKTYPLGLGTVTGIYFNPWWYPTPYSRQVFRDRGIELPKAVPPGDPLNYMGPFKIALSHRTSKGAIYRVHGNNNPKRVGHRVTGGCFVMDNTAGIALAYKIKVGTEVNIVP
jgi:lipoprotein-anchoring transpeptidase ErfK/SrfK